MTEPVVTIPTGTRWEEGIEHDPRTIDLFQFMQQYDHEFAGGQLDLQSGGDGDLGESLMYLMDEYFAAVDRGSA